MHHNPNLIEDTNYFLNNKWHVILLECPDVSFNAVRANLPGVSLPPIMKPNIYEHIPLPGTKLDFEQSFSIEFLVSKDLSNYIHLLSWIVKLGRSQNGNQYKSLKESEPLWVSKSSNRVGVTDIDVSLQTSTYNPNYVFHFADAFPISLSQLNLDTGIQKPTPVIATATFAYLYYDVIKTY